MVHVRSTDTIPYPTYGSYIAALSEKYEAYKLLHHVFASNFSMEDSILSRWTSIKGSVKIADAIDGELEMESYRIFKDESGGQVRACLDKLNHRPPKSETRIIIVNYLRDPATGIYAGVNRDILDTLGMKLSIPPEIYMWHFGSNYGLIRHVGDDGNYPPSASPLSNPSFFHLYNDTSLISIHEHQIEGSQNSSTSVWTRKN